jgi:hypothetical protein
MDARRREIAARLAHAAHGESHCPGIHVAPSDVMSLVQRRASVLFDRAPRPFSKVHPPVWIAILVLASAGPLAAQPAELPGDVPDDIVDVPEPNAEPPPGERTAAAIAGAPRPGDESGRVDDRESDSTTRRIARGALAVPRGVFELAFTPVRATVWVFDRYHVAERTRRLFFNDAGTVGLYPIASLESDFGLSAGARFVAKLGGRDRTRLDARIGGRYRQLVSWRLDGSHPDQRLRYGLRLEYDRRPGERFYGIGNADEVSAMAVAPGLIDARFDDTAVGTRFRQQLERAAVSLGVRAAGPLHVRAAATYTDLELGASDVGTPITAVYMPGSLVGFDGVRHLYGEFELAWDSRRPAHRWDSGAVYSAGWLVSAFAGRVGMVGDADFWRYGGDLQRFIRLGQGPRVLALRLHGEAVTGAHDAVPFTELPALGGSSMLRGYPTERFRDRIAALGTAEYEWDLGRAVFGSVFVDAGRVFSSIDELGQLGLGNLRCGYGFALEVHSGRSVLARASIASSVDGGVFLDLRFDPVFDVDPREVRR